MATPFCLALRRRFPTAAVSILCRSYVADVFRGNPAADLVTEYVRGDVPRSMVAARRMRPRVGFDVCFVMPPSFAAALIALSSGARRRVGYRFEGRSFLLTDSLPTSRYRTGHLSAAYLGLLEHVTGIREADLPLPAVTPPAGWRETAHGLTGERDYIVLAPGATYGSSKVWPIDRFGSLARRLADQTGWTIVVVGAAGERSVGSRILAEAGIAGENLAGATTLGELISILRGARITIGNDSGPVHLAAALGRPTVAVFGPTSIEWTAPRGVAVRIVRGEAACSPCFKRECPAGTLECLLMVDVDEVYHAAARLIEEDTGGKQ
jgi:heptosyltransferase-2